jgi:hypothetical protein
MPYAMRASLIEVEVEYADIQLRGVRVRDNG